MSDFEIDNDVELESPRLDLPALDEFRARNFARLHRLKKADECNLQTLHQPESA